MEVFIDELSKISLSLLLGSLLGLEREYRCRPAGFRTIALICVGATLFTILSQRMGSELGQDRIAANIVTGIGFIGAGVIFKQGLNVYGLTTAATIWIAAGLGMCVGAGEYMLSWVVLIISLTILSVFEYMQGQIDFLHKRRYYIIKIQGTQYDAVIEDSLQDRRLSYIKVKERRKNDETICEYEIYGKPKNLNSFNEFLLISKEVVEFEY